MNLLVNETVEIDGHQVDICTDGYGSLYVLSDEPRFCITEQEASKQDLIYSAKITIEAWHRWTGDHRWTGSKI